MPGNTSQHSRRGKLMTDRRTGKPDHVAAEYHYYAQPSNLGNRSPIGPMLATVYVTDDGVHTPSYYLHLDGVHQCGGFADHFDPANPSCLSSFRLSPREAS